VATAAGRRNHFSLPESETACRCGAPQVAEWHKLSEKPGPHYQEFARL
jgi:hypothetical protein